MRKARELTLHFNEYGHQSGIGGVIDILKEAPNSVITFREVLIPDTIQGEKIFDLQKRNNELEVRCANLEKSYREAYPETVKAARDTAISGVMRFLNGEKAKEMFFSNGKATSPQFWATAIQDKFGGGK